MTDKRVDNSYTYRTYAGVMEGLPSAKSVIEQAERTAIELWSKRPTLVIQPTIKSGRLPTWTHLVWASGPTDNKEADGSELVIIWWSEIGPDTERVLAAVEWNKHAKDFSY